LGTHAGIGFEAAGAEDYAAFGEDVLRVAVVQEGYAGYGG